MKKKIFILSGVIGLFIIGIVIYNLKGTYAGQGCCSWHGGQNYCGSDGYWYCNDGTKSPSCTCSSDELSDTQDNTSDEILTLDEYKEKYQNDDDVIDETYNAKADEVEENYKDKKEDNIDIITDIITCIIVGSILFFDIYALIKINTKK